MYLNIVNIIYIYKSYHFHYTHSLPPSIHYFRWSSPFSGCNVLRKIDPENHPSSTPHSWTHGSVQPLVWGDCTHKFPSVNPHGCPGMGYLPTCPILYTNTTISNRVSVTVTMVVKFHSQLWYLFDQIPNADMNMETVLCQVGNCMVTKYQC